MASGDAHENNFGWRVRTSSSARRAEEPTELATIKIEPAEAVGNESAFVGIAFMDECCGRDMYSGRSTEFRVEAGEHLVTVHLGRRYRIADYLGRAKASLNVVVCGRVSSLILSMAFRPTGSLHSEQGFSGPCLWLVGSVLAFGIGWNVSPHLREVVASTTASWECGNRGAMLGFVVSTKQATAMVAMYAWFLGRSSSRDSSDGCSCGWRASRVHTF